VCVTHARGAILDGSFQCKQNSDSRKGIDIGAKTDDIIITWKKVKWKED